MLQFWHPYFVEQYTKMVQALGAHLAAADYAGKILGVRQNFDAVGTEGTDVRTTQAARYYVLKICP